MQFSLLGLDDDTFELARRIASSSRHALIAAIRCEARRDDLAGWAPQLVFDDSWESLLAASNVDAVIVAASDPRALADPVLSAEALLEDQLRKLVQAAIPIVVSHPICDTLMAYELEMMRQESGGLIVPYSPGRNHPAVRGLAEYVNEPERSPVGRIEQVIFERQLADRRREAVLRQFRRDAAWIVPFIGDVDSVNAAGGAGGDDYARLNVTLAGTTGVSARWQVQPDLAGQVDSVTLVGGHGKLTWWCGLTGPASIEVNGVAQELAQAAPGDVIDELADVLDSGSADRADWTGACRDLDLGDQVAASVRRKRTIELRRDDKPEEHAFKGIMAAGGCLLLAVALFALLLFATLDGVRMAMFDDGDAGEEPAAAPVSLLIRLWPVYPLVAFLVLQLLVFVAKRPSLTQKPDPPPEKPSKTTIGS